MITCMSLTTITLNSSTLGLQWSSNTEVDNHCKTSVLEKSRNWVRITTY